jgi:hypothetical protein
MKTETTHLQTYRALLASGLSQRDACYSMMHDHGLSLDDAAALAWQAAGQRMPDRDDHRAIGAYYRRAERAYAGE